MRRSDQRRLEAALSRLATYGADTITDPSDADDVVRELETAIGDVADRASRAVDRNARLEAALNLLGVGVVVCDERGGPVYRNLAASNYGRARLGEVLAERAIADVLEEAVGGVRADRSLELFSPVRRNLRVRAFPIATLDGPLGAVAVIEDTSERRRIDAIRRDFVANVSHELKTPVGALSLLAETLDGEDDPEVIGRLARRVATEAERLGRIIDDLLDLSRIETDDHPHASMVTVGEVLEEAIGPLRAVAAAKAIALDVDNPAPRLAIPGIRRDLVSAVRNLVDNAIKYSEEASRVQVQVRVAARLGSVQIEVVDQGIGIPARDRERIFERFYRVDRARSRLTGGSGLGLSIVRNVAANHGGTVSVESQEGEGSTFTLVLPTSPELDLLAGRDPNGSTRNGAGPAEAEAEAADG